MYRLNAVDQATLVIEPHEAGARLDRVLAQRFPDRSRQSLQRLVTAGAILLNDEETRKRTTVQAGDIVAIHWPDQDARPLEPQPLPLDILFEDEELLAVNKQPGLAVHPGAGRPDCTLVNALLAHHPAIQRCGDPMRPGIVHRLDMDTSGVMVVAKTEKARLALIHTFSERRTTKEYLALTHGAPSSDPIETLIGRHPKNRKKMAVVERNGRPALSYPLTIAQAEGTALVRIRIETGRTHQIRVHLSHTGNPIVGDAVYGKRQDDAPRQMLHAWRLALPHPKHGDTLELSTPPPDDFITTASKLGISVDLPD